MARHHSARAIASPIPVPRVVAAGGEERIKNPLAAQPRDRLAVT